MTKFNLQSLLSIMIVLFCCLSISAGKSEPAYWSTLSAIIGYWLPTPTEGERK